MKPVSSLQDPAAPVMLDDLFDRQELARMLSERYVKITRHPELPLRILNYTNHTQFDNEWNDVTRACRGLIVDDAERVVARPFAKFFNLDQHTDRALPVGEVHVTEKLDGSLGILYPTPDGHAVATRGSFTSMQALHATALWRERYEDTAELNPNWTYLCEIIYPANRIVVDYNGLDDLILLGAVELATGRSVPLHNARSGWPGPVVEEHPYTTLQAAIAAEPRSNAEGFVVHFVADDVRVKLKHSEYVTLHRLITGVSERRVWEALSSGVDHDEWLTGVPDELFHFVRTTRETLRARFAELEAGLQTAHTELLAGLPAGYTRKDFAEAVAELLPKYPLAKGLFALQDGKDYSRLLWGELRPAEHVPFFQQSLDAD